MKLESVALCISSPRNMSLESPRVIITLHEFLLASTLKTGNLQFRYDYQVLKCVHFGHVHSYLFAPVNARVHGKVLSLSYHAMVIFEQFFSSKAHFPAMSFTKSRGLLKR